jgi:hypothetical protein
MIGSLVSALALGRCQAFRVVMTATWRKGRQPLSATLSTTFPQSFFVQHITLHAPSTFFQTQNDPINS